MRGATENDSNSAVPPFEKVKKRIRGENPEATRVRRRKKGSQRTSGQRKKKALQARGGGKDRGEKGKKGKKKVKAPNTAEKALGEGRGTLIISKSRGPAMLGGGGRKKAFRAEKLKKGRSAKSRREDNPKTKAWTRRGKEGRLNVQRAFHGEVPPREFPF